MSIWHNKNLQLSDFADFGKNTLGEHLSIQFIGLSHNLLKAIMTVGKRTINPIVYYTVGL